LAATKAASKDPRPDDLVSGTGLGSFRCFAILDATFVAQVTTFLGLSLAFRGLTVFVSLFLHEASGFLNLTFNAHCMLLISPSAINLNGGQTVPSVNAADDVALQRYFGSN
jgi:hypothetical protein